MSSRCNNPYKQKDGVAFPCGKCHSCLKRRVSGWSFRLMTECKRSKSAYFVTLTYDEQNVPITNNGFMSLVRRDVQLWMKKLRKVNKEKLKYYLCGEYGEKFGRPHYHVILFNADLETLVGKKVARGMQQKLIPMDGKYHAMCDSWNNGYVTVGKVNVKSVGYTLEYIHKGRVVPAHQRDDRTKEFSLMSKGMGDNYVNDRTKAWHMADMKDSMYLTIEDGKKIAMPRYIKDKIYTPDQKAEINAHLSAQYVEKYHAQTYEEFEQEQRILENERRKNSTETRKTSI